MLTAIVDTESDGLVADATRLWCAVVKTVDSDKRRSFTPDDVDDLCGFLDLFDCLCGHNIIAHDLPLLRKLYGYEYKGRVIDTLLMSRTQRPDRALPKGCPRSAGPHSVEAWGWRVGRGKVQYEDWYTYTPDMLRRCEEDVEIQHLILKALEKEGEGEGWEMAHRLISQTFRYLRMQEEYGWTVDQTHIQRCLSTLDRWIGRIDRVIAPKLPIISQPLEGREDGEFKWVKKPFLQSGKEAAIVDNWRADTGCVHPVSGPFSRVSFRPVDLDKSAEVKDYLLSLGWEPDEWNTRKDENGKDVRTSPKLSKNDSFSGIKGTLGRLVAKRVQCRQRRGVIEGWTDRIRDDGRISPTYSGLASTGRLRHSGIVNVPSPDSGAFFARSMRRIFIAKPGWVMIGVDSKGNQQRQLVARCGMDLNCPYAFGVLHGKKSDGTDEHTAVQRMANLPNRTLAKNVGYGTIFGAQDRKISEYVGGDLAEARRVREAVIAAIPGLAELKDRLSAEWRATAKRIWNPRYNRFEYKDGFITGLDGRPIQVESEHMLLVYLLQSDEAIQMAGAYCWFHKQMFDRGYQWKRDWGMLIWYHDEFQFECRPEIAETAKTLAEESVAWAGRFYKIPVPHEGEAKIGNNWLETH